MDLKTLRLASISLTGELLERFVTYQRTLLAELAKSTEAEWSGRFAFAHGYALKAAQLDVVELGKVKALVGEFCGRRSALREVNERLGQWKASDDTGRQVLERAEKELPRLEDLSDLEARYGKDAVALLSAREEELIGLHRQLVRAEGGGQGHLHAPG
ncbi:MAG: hypothetical protein AB1730_10715 [Myxococcota bacterium]